MFGYGPEAFEDAISGVTPGELRSRGGTQRTSRNATVAATAPTGAPAMTWADV